jgi:hypothetical protein
MLPQLFDNHCAMIRAITSVVPPGGYGPPTHGCGIVGCSDRQMATSNEQKTAAIREAAACILLAIVVVSGNCGDAMITKTVVSFLHVAQRMPDNQNQRRTLI